MSCTNQAFLFSAVSATMLALFFIYSSASLETASSPTIYTSLMVASSYSSISIWYIWGLAGALSRGSSWNLEDTFWTTKEEEPFPILTHTETTAGTIAPNLHAAARSWRPFAVARAEDSFARLGSHFEALIRHRRP